MSINDIHNTNTTTAANSIFQYVQPKTDKKFILFFDVAPELVSVHLIYPVLTTYAPKPMKIYLMKFYITQTMFCIASCRPSLIPHIITTLDRTHMTDHCPKN